MLIEDYNYFHNKTYKTGNGSKVKVYFNNDDSHITLWVNVTYASNVNEDIDHLIVTPLECDICQRNELDNYFNEYFAQMEY